MYKCNSLQSLSHTGGLRQDSGQESKAVWAGGLEVYLHWSSEGFWSWSPQGSPKTKHEMVRKIWDEGNKALRKTGFHLVLRIYF